jgi:hypothetical protein
MNHSAKNTEGDFPFLYPGMRHGMITQAFLEAVDELGIFDDLALTAGIGYSA